MPSIESDSHTPEEIATAVSAMKNGKSPGPEGFPTKFYRTFSGLLGPFLSWLFAECLNNTSKLQPSLFQASISLLLKKNKDPLECGSYRPISLLNCDYKIIAKLAAPSNTL